MAVFQYSLQDRRTQSLLQNLHDLNAERCDSNFVSPRPIEGNRFQRQSALSNHSDHPDARQQQNTDHSTGSRRSVGCL